MTRRHLYLGIDGGASRSRARLRDHAGRLLGEGEAGPANVVIDPGGARAEVEKAAAAALRSAGLVQAEMARCHAGLGLAGAGRLDMRDRFLDGWNPFAGVHVESDAHIAWLGAHGGSDGAVVILGTGSICYGRLGGERHVLGGWGAELSDEAGGSAIGREALRRSIWAWDGRAAMTPLAENLLAMFGGTPVLMAAAARDATPADFAAYAPLVFQFAQQDDPLAAAILKEKSEQVVQMIDRLVMLDFSRITLVGGMAAAIVPWLPQALQVQLCPAQADAIEGAVMLAQQAAAG